MQAKVGAFTAPASTTGNQAVTGVGFLPTALIVWTTYQTAAGYTDAVYFGIGFTDGTTMHWQAAATDDNTSPNDTNRTREETSLVRIENLTSTNIRVGAFVSFDADGFTINWTTADAVAPIFHYIALDATVEIGRAVDATLPAAQSPALTIPPKAVLFLQTVGDGDEGNAPNIGWATIDADGAPNGQGACAISIEDGQATQDVWRFQQSDRCSVILSSTTGALFNTLAWMVTGLGTVSDSGAVPVAFLALSDVSAKAGALNQPTSTGTQAVSGLGFTPKVVILMSVGSVTTSGAQTQARFSFGAGDGTTQGRSWIGSEDSVNPSQAAKGHSTSVILSAVATVNATGASNAADAECALDSLDVDGFTLDWTVADATAREVLWLALGDEAAAPPSGSETAVGYIG